MICKSCGAFLSDDLTECPVCGTIVSDENADIDSATENASIDNNVEPPIHESTTEETTVESNDSDTDDSTTLTDEEIEAILEKEAGEEYDIKEEISVSSSNDNESGMRADGIYIDQMEDAPVAKKKKISSSGIIAIVLAALLVVAVAFCVVLIAGRNEESPLNGVYTSITGFFGKVFSDNKVVENKPDDVVASFGDHKLTNAQLAIYYYDLVYYMYNAYGSSAFDPSTSLFEQQYSYTETWGDLFLESSIDSWHSTMVLYDLAKAANYELSEEYKTEIANMSENLEKTAVANGYTDGNEYIAALYGSYVNADEYLTYINEYYYANLFFEEKMMAQYYDYIDDGIDTLETFNVSVRHILITPETEDDEASLAAAKLEAEDIYKKWQDGGATEELFIEYVTTYSEDTASVPYGGLYEDFGEGSMVESFEKWSFDTSRKYGDSGIVESEYGYHIMFFVTRTNPDAYTKASNEMNEWLTGEIALTNLNKDLDKVTIKLATAF